MVDIEVSVWYMCTRIIDYNEPNYRMIINFAVSIANSQCQYRYQVHDVYNIIIVIYFVIHTIQLPFSSLVQNAPVTK